MNILLPSDVFPPGSVGGAAWSAHALALALLARGHRVTAVVPTMQAAAPAPDTVPTVYHRYYAPRIPFVQNYYRYERLWPALADLLTRLGREQAAAGEKLVIHAQHAQTIPAAVLAGQRLGVPVIATVRDHWPWDYFATGLHANRLPLPPRITIAGQLAALATDLPGRMGPGRGALALPALPYLLTHLRRRRALLARADAVVAVSGYIRDRLAHVASAERLHVIPNMVDIAALERIAAAPPETLPDILHDAPFLLFIGKLERNKGAHMLGEIMRLLRKELADIPPLLIAGSGALRAELEQEMTQCSISAHFLAWVPHDEIVRLMARCTTLLFPSAWGEPLSRVLLEAGALGTPIVAMPTGGTRDIIQDGENGLLAATSAQVARRMAWLLQHPDERRRLGEQAREGARQRFAVEAVLPRIESLYTRL
jgi:glycosyltransferase involved in cell wall biosynthesis